MANFSSVLNSKTIKINYLLNCLRVVSGALVGIVLLPYITRVLGPENFGKVEYIYTFINYFVLFSALGIPMYGIREISKVRNDKHETAKIILELYCILFVSTVVSYLIIFGIFWQLSAFSAYRDLILVFSAMVMLSNIGAEWYFQGSENQLFMTVRYLIVRALAVVFVFVLIQKPDDYIYYAGFLLLTACGANIINFFYLSKFILSQKISWRDLEIKKHLKPVLTIFAATISVNIYLQLDNLLIGSISGDKYVGYYSVANKLIRVVISFITILGAVMLPRLSFLYLNDRPLYNDYLKKSFGILLMMSLPFTIYFLVFSKNIVGIMSGNDFKESILTMQILSPLCFIVSMAYFMGFLILYPQNKEKFYTTATIVSAVFSILVNFFMIRLFRHNGAAVVAVVAELLAIFVMFYFIKKNKLVEGVFDKNMRVIGVAALGMFVFSILISGLFQEMNVSTFILVSILSFGVYAAIMFLLKEKISMEMYSRYIRKIKK
ncbi:MAG: flippase [Bergeyella sp.]